MTDPSRCVLDSSNLTHQQCRRMFDSLYPLANYIARLHQRMEKRGFPGDDPLYLKARAAYESLLTLRVELHYRSCQSGVYRGERD
jgi:hypothetical protein